MNFPASGTVNAMRHGRHHDQSSFLRDKQRQVGTTHYATGGDHKHASSLKIASKTKRNDNILIYHRLCASDDRTVAHQMHQEWSRPTHTVHSNRHHRSRSIYRGNNSFLSGFSPQVQQHLKELCDPPMRKINLMWPHQKSTKVQGVA